jgi:hypothetical protein
MTRLRLLVATCASALLLAGCGGGSSDGALPATVVHASPGDATAKPFDRGSCGSWLGSGVAAAYCADGQTAPGPSGEAAELSFSGTGVGAGSAQGIAQVMGALTPDRDIGLTAHGPVSGELLVQGYADQKIVIAVFAHLRMKAGDRGTLRLSMSGSTPVAHVLVGDRDLIADREQIVELPSYPAPSGPQADRRFVDCASIGSPVSVSDPQNDVGMNVSQDAHLTDPGADITSVAVARSDTQLCVNYTLAAAPNAPLLLRLAVRTRADSDSGALVEVGADLADDARYVQLGYPGADDDPGHGIVPGSVGIDGNVVSVLVGRDQLPDWTPYDQFQFDASSVYSVAPNIQEMDCAGDPLVRTTYPDGAAVHLAEGAAGSC